ncbi:MAG: efflux RND transporter periplasmic adaptor subunit [Bacteroidales bacterium]|nr:efflux RND transporter periplasmic adaptor subunit [Bacteroidales bacterium]
MKKKMVIIGIASVIGVVIVIMIILFTTKTTTLALQVETATVKKGNICTVVTATGTIQPIKQVNVGTQVSGVVQKIYADYNSKVKAGQLIAELDKTNLKALVSESKASYFTALNELDYLQKVFNRQESLYKNKVISEADYEESLYKLNNAKGAVEQRKSDLQRAETNLGYADIYSPIDGVILTKSVDVGQTVAASFSTPTLFTIAQDLSEMQVEANVDEADIGNVTEGQRVTFTVDAFPGENFSGKVTQVRLNGTVKSNVVTYTVVITAENPKQKLKPGLTATISIYTVELNNTNVVEAAAVDYQPDPAQVSKYNAQTGIPVALSATQNNAAALPATPDNGTMKTVWLLDKAGIHQKQILVGKSDRVNVQVLEGLKEGDKVVTGISMAAATTASGTSDSSSANSPFMPAPPGKKK